MRPDRLTLIRRVWGLAYYLRRVGSMTATRLAADRLCVALAHLPDDAAELEEHAVRVAQLCDITLRLLPVAGRA